MVFDRRQNTASMVGATGFMDEEEVKRRITWDVEDPNALRISLPRGLAITTRVTRRSQADVPGANRTETSEYVQQVFDDAGAAGEPRVKASQVFTKYLWRDAESLAQAGGGPAIVATQTVGDFVTPYDGNDKMMRAGNRPVVRYTYRMAFTPRAAGDGPGAAR